MASLLMFLFSEWDPTDLDKVSNNYQDSTLVERFVYCYHSINIISFTPSQKDHTYRLTL